MRPSIQRSTEQTRVSPAARRLHGHRSVAREERLGHLEIRVGTDAAQPGDLGADRGRGIHTLTVPLRSMHPDEVAARGAVVPEGGVLAMVDERQPAFGQRVLGSAASATRAEPGDLRAAGGHALGLHELCPARSVAATPRTIHDSGSASGWNP